MSLRAGQEKACEGHKGLDWAFIVFGLVEFFCFIFVWASAVCQVQSKCGG